MEEYCHWMIINQENYVTFLQIFFYQQKQMINTTFKENHLFETGFSYSPAKEAFQLKTSRTISNLDKENVIPCAAQVQGFVASLNQKKYQLKNLMLQKQRLSELSAEQQTKLDTQSIRQNYEVERQDDLHSLNMRTSDEIELLKKEKLKNMQKLLGLKKSLEQRFDQILEMKKLAADLQDQNSTMDEQIKQMNKENEALQNQNNELDLMSQNLDSEHLHMRQSVRESEVRYTTTQKALNMFKVRLQDSVINIKAQNKQTRRLAQAMTEVGDKIKRLREQRAELDINSSQLTIRNKHIQDTNIKLRNDLEKCKGHLFCVMKNNEILGNSIEEFTYVDERVSKIIKKNELKKL